MAELRTVFVAGGAGFLGSHFADRLLSTPALERLTVYDNFSSGRRWHLAAHAGDPRLTIVEGDILDEDRLAAALAGHQAVIHLASNPDIARAAVDPDVDFRQGTALTRNVAEAARRCGVELVLYASGSGVYGDRGEALLGEDAPCEPVSTYGASKLAGEALLAASAHMFGIRARAFRFGNVVGPRQTHGVGYDFLRKLRQDPRRLAVLGDGSQAKPYVHAGDVVDAVLLAAERDASPFAVYNVATDDLLPVREIAALAIDCLGLDPTALEVSFGDSPRGWPGDVPVVRLDSARIRGLGWRPRHDSRQAMAAALAAMRDESLAEAPR